MNKSMLIEIIFYRDVTPAERAAIGPGPVPHTVVVEGTVSRAKEYARTMANVRGWRVWEINKQGETRTERMGHELTIDGFSKEVSQ